MAQEQVQKQSSKSDTAEDLPEIKTPQRNEKLADDVDGLLDEIDDVLEENAEEFVRGYVQKGGQ